MGKGRYRMILVPFRGHQIKGRLFILFLALLLVSSALASTLSAGQESVDEAQGEPLHPGRSVFRTYGRDLRFPSSAIHHLIQDEAGFLWMGTENGLFRYDGHATTHWGAADGLPSDWILRLLPHPDGGFWVGTSLGLARFHNGVSTPVTLEGELWTFHVASMDLDQSRKLVVAGSGTLLVQVSETDLAPLKDCPAGVVHDVKALRSGSLVFAGELSIHERLPSGRWILYGPEDGLTFQPGQLKEDGLGNLWVFNGRFLAVKKAGSDRFEDRSTWMPGAFYSGGDAFTDEQGFVWLPTLEGALRVRGDAHQTLGVGEGMPSRHIKGVFLDRENSLWVYASVLYRQLGQGCVTAYTQQDGLPSDVVWSIYQDPGGTIWAGTGDGLARLGVRGWERIKGSEGMAILSMDKDADGNLWLTNLNGSPARLGPDDQITTLKAFGVTGRSMWVSTEGDGKVWFSLLGGQNVVLYDSRTRSLTPISEIYPEVTEIVPRSLYQDNRGRTWIAGTLGLACRDGDHWHLVKETDGLRSPKVRGLALMDDGTAWVWYVEPYGMTRLGFQDGRLRVLGHLDTSGNLASNLIYAAALGQNGDMWITTDRGVNQYHQGQIRHFGIEEGLLTEDCNLNALAIDRTGNVWVGSSSGIARIWADRLPKQGAVPAPMILRFDDLKASYSAPFGSIPPIPHALGSVEFRFSTPTYLDERNLRYEVRLLGLEDTWYPTEIRQTRYPALRGGRYRFEVRVARPGSPFGPASGLDFEILPAWWQSIWFYGLVFAGLVGLVALLIRWRVRHLQAAKKVLAALVAERTLELEQANRALGESNSALKEQSLTDPLTGLRNRRFITLGIQEDLARALRQNRQRQQGESWDNVDLVFFIVDLDRFKAVNDTYGHRTGDEVLVQVAEVLRRTMRDSDTIARWGGEEFLLLARDTTRAEATKMAERIRAAVEGHPFLTESGLTLRSTCSIGFASYPFLAQHPTWISWEKVVDLADHGLYLVKENGRNGWIGFDAGTALGPDQDPVTLIGQIPQAIRDDRLTIQTSRPLPGGETPPTG